jgi:hypothetical protein
VLSWTDAGIVLLILRAFIAMGFYVAAERQLARRRDGTARTRGAAAAVARGHGRVRGIQAKNPRQEGVPCGGGKFLPENRFSRRLNLWQRPMIPAVTGDTRVKEKAPAGESLHRGKVTAGPYAKPAARPVSRLACPSRSDSQHTTAMQLG